MVECDLRQTKDGHVVIAHDPTLLRTHDDRRAVRHLTLEEIKDISRKEGNEIPELSEYLEAATVPVNLEIKVAGIEEQILEAVKNFPHKVLISSSNPYILKKVRALDGKIPLGFIVGPNWNHVFPIAMAVARTLDLYSIHPVEYMVTPAHMKSMRRLGVKVFAWTINDIHQLMVMKGMGVDGVFTDYPNFIK
jgi:glycerophosphoryl diester phosphodiesterase